MREDAFVDHQEEARRGAPIGDLYSDVRGEARPLWLYR
jgi:hypothetical protein